MEVRARAAAGGLVALVVLTVAAVVPGSAAGAAEVSIGFVTGDRYVRPGVTSTTVTYCLGAASTVDVEVRDAEGEVVRHVQSGVARRATSCSDVSPSVTWDLTDDEGDRVPDGVYEVVVHAVTETGDEGTGSVRRGVYSGPVVEITEPAAGASVSGVTTLTARFAPELLAIFTPDRASFACGPAGGGLFPSVGDTTEISPSGDATIEADLGPCRAGPAEIIVSVRLVDPFGVRDEILFAARQPVVVAVPGPFTVALRDTPTEGWSYTFEQMTLRGCVSRSAHLAVTVRDAAGSVVRDLSSSEPVPPSDCSSSSTTFATWDHTDASGAVVPEGTYEIEVVAVDASGSEVPAPTASVAVTRHVVVMEPLQVTEPAPGATVSGPTTVTVRRAPGADADVAVALIVDCTTGPGAGSLAWSSLPSGVVERSLTVDVQICKDGAQQLSVAGLVLDPGGRLHIADTRVPVTVFHPTLSPGVGQVVEGDAGSSVVEVPVTLSAPSPFPVTATWRAVDGSASAGSDFDAVTSGTVTFAPGQTEATLSLTVHGDAEAEWDEMAFVRLNRPDRARLGGLFGLGFGLVLDDDSGPRARAAGVTVVEGDSGTTTASVPVTLSEPSSEPVTVTWRTVDNSATAPGDYDAVTSGTVTFAPGQTEATIDVAVRGDTVDEGEEIVVVHLTGATEGSVGGWLGLGFAFITDDV